MTNFTIKVRPDHDNVGTNKIEVFFDNYPKREIMILTDRGDDLPPLDEEIRPEDEALYYAVERIAQLEAEQANPTMQVAQNKWRDAALERDELLTLFEFLEQEAKRSRTGISFDWVPTCEGEPSGYRFMRHHHIGQPSKSLRKAIEQRQKTNDPA